MGLLMVDVVHAEVMEERLALNAGLVMVTVMVQ